MHFYSIITNYYSFFIFFNIEGNLYVNFFLKTILFILVTPCKRINALWNQAAAAFFGATVLQYGGCTKIQKDVISEAVPPEI